MTGGADRARSSGDAPVGPAPSRNPDRWLQGLLEHQQVLVILGSGGVGKTTLAATLALQAARLGRRTLVLTIDPARRLANALGLAEFKAERQPVALAELGAIHAAPGSAHLGELWAMMLDAPRTFDSLVERHASSPAARDRILGHRLYRHMVAALAGSHDLAAMEQLHRLVNEAEYDLIVLDTPPKEHAFDFFDAPNRLIGMVNQSRLRWLLVPMANLEERGLFQLTPRLIQRTLAHFTGGQVLKDLATLTLALLDLGQGLEERAHLVEQLLRSSTSGFLVVTRPDALTVTEATEQRAKLLELGLPFAGFLINRCVRLPRQAPPTEPAQRFQTLVEQLAQDPAAAAELRADRLRALLLDLGRGLRLLQIKAKIEQQTVQPLFALVQAGCPPPLLIPELDEEIHSVEQLLRFGNLILTPDQQG